MTKNGMRVEETSRSVIIMNAHCIIQIANKGTYDLFGYGKRNELRGKNVNVLIPVRAVGRGRGRVGRGIRAAMEGVVWEGARGTRDTSGHGWPN